MYDFTASHIARELRHPKHTSDFFSTDVFALNLLRQIRIATRGLCGLVVVQCPHFYQIGSAANGVWIDV